MKLNITELVKGLGLRVIFLEMFYPNPLALVFPLILLWKLQSFSSCNMLGFFPLLFFNYFFYVVPYPTLSIAMLLKFWVNWKLLKNYFVELHSVLVTVMPPAANSGNCWRRDRSSSSVSSSKFTGSNLSNFVVYICNREAWFYLRIPLVLLSWQSWLLCVCPGAFYRRETFLFSHFF